MNICGQECLTEPTSGKNNNNTYPLFFIPLNLRGGHKGPRCTKYADQHTNNPGHGPLVTLGINHCNLIGQRKTRDCNMFVIHAN